MKKWLKITLAGVAVAVLAGGGIVAWQVRTAVSADCRVTTIDLARCDVRESGGQCAATQCEFSGWGRKCATVYLRRQDGRVMHSEPICYDGVNDARRTVTETSAFPTSPVLFCADPLLPFDQSCALSVELEPWP